jgi:hypothetical protein
VYDESVIVRIEEWLNAFGEVLIEPYYPYGGSSGTRYFISSLSGFLDMVAKAPAGEVFGAVFFIYRPPRFPLVGTVDGDFIQLALSEVQEGTWYLIVATDDYYPAELSTFGEGESRRELEQRSSKSAEDARCASASFPSGQKRGGPRAAMIRLS